MRKFVSLINLKNTDNTNHKCFTHEGLLLAFISSGTYLCAFLYEVGFFRYYQIPYILIQITISQICITFLAILSIVYTVYLALDLIYKLTPQDKKQELWLYFPLAYLLAFSVLFILSDTNSLAQLLWLLIIILMMVGTYVLPMFYGKGTYNERLLSSLKYDSENVTKSIDVEINKAIGPKYFWLTISLIFFGSLSNVLGYSSAKKLEEKQTTVFEGVTYILIRKYDNESILVEYDTVNKTHTGSYLVTNGTLKYDPIKDR